MNHQSVDAVVIGAGVMGASIALELARGGRDVLVVDRAGDIGHGSTSASSGIVRFHYSTLLGVAVAWESRHAWRDWEEHLGVRDPAGLATFQRTGMLVLEPLADASSAATRLFDQVGVPWETWDAAAIVGRLPFVDPGRFGPPVRVDSEAFFAEPRGTLAGSFTPDAGHVGDPQLAARNLATAARHHGARFRPRTEITSIEATGGRRWRLSTASSDVFSTDVVVNAAGPWSSRVNALAGVGDDFTVASRPLRQEVHEVPAPPGFDLPDGSPGIAIADPDLGIYVRSAGNGNVLVGGMEPECDPLDWLDDPDACAPRPTPPVFEAQVMRAARRFPGLTVPNRPTGIAGVYDATTDWAPIYDRTSADGFYVAMGTSGNQFKNAPVVGLIVERLVDAVESGQDHDLDPVRVRLHRTGQEISLGGYSRRRPVDANAPASVLG